MKKHPIKIIREHILLHQMRDTGGAVNRFPTPVTENGAKTGTVEEISYRETTVASLQDSPRI